MVTKEMVERVGERVGKGLWLRHACAMETPQVSEQHFQKAIDKSPVLSARYDKSVALSIAPELDAIRSGECRGWQGKAWILERRHGYSTKSAPNVQVTVNTCVGLSDEVQKRAALFVKRARVESEPKQIDGH